ncbi:epidermal growth factor receptor kinase substrate 8-like protein 3b isoform X2 [Betta splendens]|uniref:Epidermal growth factor receptor kinase substrate 8-like protein 3b isoform X2 n=1 Tax=Betta splendens TaxID=158456 RepID=A0A9W2XVW5_BETSP|nr:epidermal growth factor receptor kinase substrate 8-like protein 3b isoform X2 [Betta splendens]
MYLQLWKHLFTTCGDKTLLCCGHCLALYRSCFHLVTMRLLLGCSTAEGVHLIPFDKRLLFFRAVLPDDLPHSRRPFQQDDVKVSPLQRNGMSRPSGKSIYMQRKNYSETLNRQSENINVRVEHLFTCELDGQAVRTADDCVAKLKVLDAKGRLWPQDMMMELQGGYLVLSDIETKAELESLPLSCIVETKAVLDSCAYNSLLLLTVQDRGKRTPQVFMFQCEETGAELIKTDLDKVGLKGGADVEPCREQSDIRSNLENIIGQHPPGSFRQGAPRSVQRDPTPPPLEYPPPRWDSPEPGIMSPPWSYTPQEEIVPPAEGAAEQEQADRNAEILNHVINDLEIFVDNVSAAVNRPVPAQKVNSKKKKNKGKQKIEPPPAALYNLPPWEEYVSCLQKIKYGFNLLGELERTLAGPSAADYVHIFFSCLTMIVPPYPADLPPSVLAPLLTDAAVQLLGRVVSPEEDELWRSLGECWNVPRSRWPTDNVPPYIPTFYDGWQPPAPVRRPNVPLSRSNSQSYMPRAMQWQPEAPEASGPWGSPPQSPNREPPQHMRVMYDFMARNNQELSLMKGELVQVIQKTKQWWLVRNTSGEEGNVPPNVLEPTRGLGSTEDFPRDSRGPVSLDMNSPPAQVKAWLEYKGFSRITVSSLGVLSGKLLLGMTKEEMRTVCPEEGSRVFFQLQAIKSAIALASEPPGMYNARY